MAIFRTHTHVFRHPSPISWFDVQVFAHRRGDLPDEALASIAGYYRRVTTAARPMNRLIAVVMLATIVAIGV